MKTESLFLKRCFLDVILYFGNNVGRFLLGQ